MDELQRPYTDQTVHIVEFMRTQYGATDDYIRHLADEWRVILDEAIREGIVLSYKVFLGLPANRKDWDVMTMIEVKNMAILDTLKDQLLPIQERLLGPGSKVAGDAVDRAKIREVLGMKVVREILLK